MASRIIQTFIFQSSDSTIDHFKMGHELELFIEEITDTICNVNADYGILLLKMVEYIFDSRVGVMPNNVQ